MITRSSAFFSLVAACAAVGACQSSSDDSTSHGGAGGGSTGGGAGSSVAGRGGNPAQAGSTNIAGTNSGGTNSGGSNGIAGTGGGAGSVASGGAAGNAAAGTAGGVNSAGNGGTSAAGSGDGGANDGDAGSTGDTPPEYAYLTTFLGGIFSFSVDLVSGKPTLLAQSPVDKNAQIYAVSVDATQRFLYVADLVNKIDLFKINDDHTLPATATLSTPMVGRPFTLALDAAGHFAYVASRTDDFKTNIDVFKIDADSGALTPAGDTLEVDGGSYLALDPTGHFAYLTGTGIRGFQVDSTSGLLTPFSGPAFGSTVVFGGAIAFRPDGKFLYTSGGGVNAFAIAADGKLDRIEGSPFNTAVSSDVTATNIAVEPRGKFLYATEFLGTAPRVFGFAIDPGSGKLQPVPGVSAPSNSPYSVSIDPSGRFAYAGNDDGTLSVFALNHTNGALQKLDDSPFPHGGLQPEVAFAKGQ